MVRADAGEYVSKIERFHKINHRYPADLEEAGISKSELSSRLGLSGYLLKDGNPNFFYAATYIPFDVWSFNFAKQEWAYND